MLDDLEKPDSSYYLRDVTEITSRLNGNKFKPISQHFYTTLLNASRRFLVDREPVLNEEFRHGSSPVLGGPSGKWNI